MHSKKPLSLSRRQFEGCPSPFTRLAEGRRDPALISFSWSAFRHAALAGACQTHFSESYLSLAMSIELDRRWP